MKPKILVVGGGSIGERHIRCFQKTERATLRLCETNPDRGAEVAARYGVPLVTEFAAALAERPDGVVICTPAHLHIPMAREAVAAGCHVLIEKPLATRLEVVAPLAEDATARGRVVAVAYVWRMHPALQRARVLLRSGALGEPLQVLAFCGQDFAALRPGYEKTYYARHDHGGGAIQDGLTHVANAVEMLVGPTTSLLCEADRLAIPLVTVEDSVGVLARHGRTLVTYAFNQTQKPNEFGIDVHGSQGSLRIDLSGKRIGVFRAGHWDFEETPYADHDVLFTAQAGAFLDAMEQKAPPACSLEEGLQTLRFNLACFEAIQTGKRVVL